MNQYNVIADAVALAAGVAKSVVAVVGPATTRHKIKAVTFAFSGVTATDAPVLVELCRSTQATAGTSTASTPVAVDAADPAALCAGAKNYTAEPTVLTPMFRTRVTPVGGTIVLQFPLGDEPTFAISTSSVWRLTAPQAQTVDATVTLLE